MADPHIGPYRLLRLLHEGGQGRVFLGYDDRLQRRVAVKIHALPEAVADRRRALNEARFLARLQHPGVVQVHDVIASDQHLAMVMEYVPGCDLEELLAKVDPPLADSLDIALGIAAVLGAAAAEGIVHGDLKAGNVLVDRQGLVKLVDFGIAGIVGEGHSGRGSLSCLAPEQAGGQRLDARSDLFALGCLLYRLLSGEYPFFREGRLDRARLLTGVFPPLPAITPTGESIPAGLAQLVAELLARDPAERPTSLAGLRQCLHQMRAALPRPLRGGLRELAAPAFREETAAELPLPLPADLLQPAHRGRDWLAWARTVGRGRTLPVLCLSVLLLVPPLLWLARGWAVPRPIQVYLPPAEVSFAPRVRLPVDEGLDWLEAEVRAALQRTLPGLQWVSHPGEVADETLRLHLQCQRELCILGLRREGSGGFDYRQALLPPAAGRAAWEILIGETVATLYAGR